MRGPSRILLLGGGLLASIIACGSDDDGMAGPAPTPPEPVCTNGNVGSFRFPHGSPDGHVDPYGAKAAKQARAGRLRDASMIVQSPDVKHQVRPGDFVLANELVAFTIEAEGASDGYNALGGEIIAADRIGDDGRPRGESQFGETIMVLSRQSVAPDKVTVLADGSDGKAAIVRASGVLKNVPFLDTFAALLQDEYDFPAAIDYVLEPGASKLLVRLHLVNTRVEPVSFLNRQFFGFFHGSRGPTFTDAVAFGESKGEQPFVAWDTGPTSFAVRALPTPLRTELTVSGFQMFSLKGLEIAGCEPKTLDYAEMVAGGPGLDGLLQAKRAAFGEPAGREIKGVVKESGGPPVAGVWVHATTADGARVLTRTRSDANGAFVLHVPEGAAALVPTAQGWPLQGGTPVTGDTTDITLPPRATLTVTIKDKATNEALPARVQVIPKTPVANRPETFGLDQESNGRIWNLYPLEGSVSVPVPPGEHRVIVTRGYEYEILDTVATAEAGKTTEIAAVLEHSVDSAGVMCADFHIHSFNSPDSFDVPEEKVRGAIADGLEIPVSSEHEWIIDFQPIVERLKMTKWAFGMPSEELTTFTWGHFGVVPLKPKTDALNNGAVNWVGKKPAEIFRQVNELPERPVLIVNHPNGTGFQGYFGQAQFDRATAKGSEELWSDQFAAMEVFNSSDFEANRQKTFADWVALMNTGKTYWIVGNSDSHHQKSDPVGYPRNCMRFGHDDPSKLTPEIVRDVLRSGNVVVSGGLTMTVTGPDGAVPGSTAKPGRYDVTVAAPSWLDASTVEVIVDGTTTETKPLGPSTGVGPGKRWQISVDVAAKDSRPRHWVVFHAKGNSDLAPMQPGKKPFAVSNPIFF